MDEFLLRALAAGLAVAAVSGPLGCFVVWRRMAYFGDALAHSSLLGIVAGLLLGISPWLGVLGLCGAAALILSRAEADRSLSADGVLGILAHGSLALGLVLLSLMDRLRVDLMGWLFGDILAVSSDDALMLWGGSALILAVLATQWRVLTAAAIDPDLARAEGHPVARARLVLMLLVAVGVAAAMKVVGVMLVTAMLIIPPAAARRLARTPEQMAVLAALAGAVAVALGLSAGWAWDIPCGPGIVTAATGLFLASRLVPRR